MARSRHPTKQSVEMLPSPNAATELTAILRLLADPTRLRIFLALREGEACVCELAAALELAENLVSHHLGVLRRAGLVEDRRDPADARWVYYHLDAERLFVIYTQVEALFDPRAIGTRSPVCGPAAGATQQRHP